MSAWNACPRVLRPGVRQFLLGLPRDDVTHNQSISALIRSGTCRNRLPKIHQVSSDQRQASIGPIGDGNLPPFPRVPRHLGESLNSWPRQFKIGRHRKCHSIGPNLRREKGSYADTLTTQRCFESTVDHQSQDGLSNLITQCRYFKCRGDCQARLAWAGHTAPLDQPAQAAYRGQYASPTALRD